METFIGEIRMFAGNFAPVGWMFCHGQTLQVSEYTALFTILDRTYGGDGSTTFCLPDLRGRMPVDVNASNWHVDLGVSGGTTSSGPFLAETRSWSSQNTPYLALNFIIAVEGVYPMRS